MTAYDPATIWLVIIAVAVGTFALKLSFIPLIGRLQSIPPRFSGVLRFVPAAVLAALVAPAILAVGVEPSFALQFEPAKVVAGVVAAVVAWRTESILATIGVGMAVLWTVQFLVL